MIGKWIKNTAGAKLPADKVPCILALRVEGGWIYAMGHVWGGNWFNEGDWEDEDGDGFEPDYFMVIPAPR